MNNTEQQDDVLNGLDFVRIHILLKPEQKDYLKKIDSNNMSNAVKTLIENHMKQTKMISFQKYVLYLVLLLCILTFSFLIYPILTG